MNLYWPLIAWERIEETSWTIRNKQTNKQTEGKWNHACC